MRRPFSPLLVALLLLMGLIVAPGAAAQIPPNPIDPNTGEWSLLDLINSLPINEIESALDNFPVPYVVVASAGGAGPFTDNKKAGSPLRVDADDSLSTGKGGHDIEVEVNTELFPTPNLVLSVKRIGNAPFAENLTVLVAFPFDAFNDEDGAGSDSPNLFFGYTTTAAFDGATYPAGGHAPESVEFIFTPDILAGTDHVFQLDIATTGANNPVRYFAGHFDGDPGSVPINALAMSAHTDPVPSTISLGLDVDASAILAGGFSSGSVGLDWEASEPSKVTFDFLENEDFPFLTPDYNTTVTFDLMPTTESLDIDVDFAAGTIALGHSANAVVDELTLRHAREDGLEVTAVGSSLPTEMDLELDVSGAVTIDVNANTLDLELEARQDGAGFPGSDAFLGYPLRYLLVQLEDVPDAVFAYDAAGRRASVTATNPAECPTCDAIGSIALVLDDDATSKTDPNLQFPPAQPIIGEPWADQGRHVFSIIDDGTHGTAAARLLSVKEATLDLSDSSATADLSEIYTLDLREPAEPLTAYLMTTPASKFTDDDVEVTCDVHDFPYGITTFGVEFPPPQMVIDYQTDPPQGIEEVLCFGNVGTLNFDLAAGDLPPEFSMTFDPGGLLGLTAGDGLGGPDRIGLIGMRLWDELNPDGLDAGTAGLLGEVLRDARFRADDIPSFEGTWSDDASGTAIDFDTDAATGPFAFLGGVQVEVSTVVEFGPPLPPPGPAEPHYARFIDEGGTSRKQLAAGVFGMNEFTYTSTEGGGARDLALRYRADEDHQLVVDLDTALGGTYFPDYGILATLTVDDVPQSWDFNTDLATQLDYTASDGINEISIVGDIEIDNGAVETTHIEALASGLPSEVHYSLVPELNGSLSLTMSNPITQVRVELSSDDAILGGDYRHMLFDVQDIPDDWSAEWGIVPNPHAGLLANAPLGPVSVIVSKDVASATPSKYDVFQNPGGAFDYGVGEREIDRRYFRLGSGDDNVRETVFMSRLDSLYDTTSQLDDGEDHVIYRGNMDFLSIQGTGFQGVSAEIVGTTINAQLDIPFVGLHPFFVGIENSEFTTVQIDNVPDTTVIAVGPEMANGDFSSSPGDIMVYQGPLPTPGHTAEALKVLVLNTPSSVHVNWDLGYDGLINIDNSGPVEVRLLNQGGGDRLIADFVVEDLNASWGAIFGEPEFFDCKDDTGFPLYIPIECGTWFVVAEAFANLTATPAIDGFVSTYELIENPSNLQDPGFVIEQDFMYRPVLNLLVDDFSELDVSVSVDVCIVPLPTPVPCIAPGAFVPHWSVGVEAGGVNFDYWDNGGGFLDILGDPDYVDNDPWDFWPIFHAQSSHVFPFN